nr:ribonuclease H-like domain-containing protein [Tanacetum cinerariifolium]
MIILVLLVKRGSSTKPPAEAVTTSCYVFNKALVTKPHNKTPYELLNGRSPRIDFMRPIGCPVTIFNTLDPLGKFKGKANKGFLVGYSVTSNAFREIELLKMQVHKMLMAMPSLDDKAEDDKPKDNTGSKTIVKLVNKEDQAYRYELERLMSQEKKASDAADALRTYTSRTFSVGEPSFTHPGAFIPNGTLLYVDQDNSQIPSLEDTTELRSTSIFTSAYDDDLDTFTSLIQSVGIEVDFNNMESSTIMEPKKVAQALDDKSWVEAMQDELLQFSLRKVLRLVDLPYGKKAIGTKWVYRNKKDERGTIVRNKA